MKLKIENLLSEIFEKKELEQVSEVVKGRIVELELVDNLNQFVKNCRQESENSKKSGPHRYDDWNEGWSGKGIYDDHPEIKNLPYYMKNNTHVRVNGKVYKDISGFTELFLLRAIQEISISKVLDRDSAISFIEYGCGTGHNLEYIRARYPNIELYGADWTETACRRLLLKGILEQKNIYKVNFFEPKTFASPPEKYYAFTNHSLEQAGQDYENFMQFLIRDSNCLGGIHIEPMRELLDQGSILDRDAHDYAERRGYLKDFSIFMKNQPIKIVECKNTTFGSKYNCGFQILIWESAIVQI